MKTQTIRRIMLITVIFITAFQPMVSVAQSVDDPPVYIEDNDYVLPVDEKIVTIKIANIGGTEGNQFQLPCGGYIISEMATPAINPDNIIDHPTITGFSEDIDGNTIVTNLYKRTLKLDYDVNVWTSVNYVEAVPAHSVNTAWKMVGGRIYVGDKLSRYQGDYNSGTDYDEAGKNYKRSGNQFDYNTYPDVKSGDYASYDGDRKFETHYYHEYYTTSPYYQFAGQAADFPNSYYNSKNLIETYVASKVASPTFDVSFEVLVDPLSGMANKIDVDAGTLELEGAWAQFGGAAILSSETTVGYCKTAPSFGEVPDEVSIMTAEDDGRNTDSRNADSFVGGGYSMDEHGVDASGQTNMLKTVSGSNLFYVSSKSDKPSIEASDFKQLPSALTLVSEDGEEYIDYRTRIVKEQIENAHNETGIWTITAKNIRLTPDINLLWQNNNYRYYEYWIDQNVWPIKDTLQTVSGKTATYPVLLGWEVNNVYTQFRISVNVDVFSKYALLVEQSPDAVINSDLSLPIEPNGEHIWSMSPYGDQGFSYSWNDPRLTDLYADLFDTDNWFDKFMKALPYIVIIGVIILVVVIMKGGAGLSGGSKTKVKIDMGNQQGGRGYPQTYGVSGVPTYGLYSTIPQQPPSQGPLYYGGNTPQFQSPTDIINKQQKRINELENRLRNQSDSI